MMRYISLFSGVGGFDLGFDRAGMECVLQVEKDKNALGVLNRHWPDVPKKEDVRDVGKQSVDLICGGFPCQDVSVSGRRAGLAGERSGLWFEFLRIIDESKPTWVVIENVPGLLSSNRGRDMGTVLGGLAKCGYWWAYRVLDAQYFSLAQRRCRVFIVASLRKGCPQEVLFEPDSSPWDTPPSREAGESFAAAITERTREAGRTLEMQEDLAYALTNPGSGGQPHSRLIAYAPDGFSSYKENLPLLRAKGGDIAPGSEAIICNDFGRRKEEIDISTALTAHKSKRDDFESETFVVANTITTEEWNRSPRSDGNDNLIWSARNFTASEDVTFTLQAKKSGYSLNYNPLVGVRRLTPLECERLQGFPDDWTAGQSDSQRYKQLGNAVAVPVAEWLGTRLMEISK